MKNLTDQRRKKWEEEGGPAKQVTLNTDADATDAMQDGDSADVVMRVGAVVAYLDANGASPDNVEYASEVQVARVTLKIKEMPPALLCVRDRLLASSAGARRTG
ncbi:hypothetical protein ACFTWS_06430 [Streptomyces sp. NPDC057027]|uniref:hypothetical protein n=1 Tax=Streptomyces sp. NPDC057027 TaxID=3346004 RepID=UPI00362E81B3